MLIPAPAIFAVVVVILLVALPIAPEVKFNAPAITVASEIPVRSLILPDETDNALYALLTTFDATVT